MCHVGTCHGFSARTPIRKIMLSPSQRQNFFIQSEIATKRHMATYRDKLRQSRRLKKKFVPRHGATKRRVKLSRPKQKLPVRHHGPTCHTYLKYFLRLILCRRNPGPTCHTYLTYFCDRFGADEPRSSLSDLPNIFL